MAQQSFLVPLIINSIRIINYHRKSNCVNQFKLTSSIKKYKSRYLTFRVYSFFLVSDWYYETIIIVIVQCFSADVKHRINFSSNDIW